MRKREITTKSCLICGKRIPRGKDNQAEYDARETCRKKYRTADGIHATTDCWRQLAKMKRGEKVVVTAPVEEKPKRSEDEIDQLDREQQLLNIEIHAKHANKFKSSEVKIFTPKEIKTFAKQYKHKTNKHPEGIFWID